MGGGELAPTAPTPSIVLCSTLLTNTACIAYIQIEYVRMATRFKISAKFIMFIQFGILNFIVTSNSRILYGQKHSASPLPF
jgi:hypothetical protein